MAMMIKEYVGHPGIEVKWHFKESMNVSESTLAAAQYAPNSLMVEHEAIHVGPTRNYTWYTREALEGSVPTWTFPYARPVIKHHNEENGDTIGRVVEVSYQEKSQLSNSGYLKLIANVPDEKGKQDIQNGLLHTVSIGAIVHEATCSICGHNIAEEGPCEHERGVEYEGKICYWMINRMEAKEISYVIVPSDKYAQVTKYWVHNKPTTSIKESFDGQKGVLDMSIPNETEQNNQVSSVKDVQEGVIIEEEGQKEGVTPEEPKAAEPEAKKDKAETEPIQEDATAKELETLKETVKTLEDKVAELEKELAAKNASLQKEVAARESLEERIISIQEAEKTELIKKVCSIKESLGLSANAEKLQSKSIEFLKESLEDLQDELSTKESVETPIVTEPEIPTQTVQNPSIAENTEENKELSVKESTVNSNTFLDDMASIMSLSMSSKRY